MSFDISDCHCVIRWKVVYSDVTCYDAFVHKKEIGKAWKYQWK